MDAIILKFIKKLMDKGEFPVKIGKCIKHNLNTQDKRFYGIPAFRDTSLKDNEILLVKTS